VRPEPALYRRTCPIWTDRSFASLAGVIRVGAVLASVRDASPPSPIEESCTAPFAAGVWLFAHNGEVTDFRTGGRTRLLREVSDRRAAEIEGAADSEVLFAMVLDLLDAGAGPPDALSAVVEKVLRLTGGRLNLVLTDGQTVAATACGDSLFAREPADEAPGYVVASEPFDDSPAWRPVPDGSVLEIDPPNGIRIEAMSG
jgi:glutamine amidotransferase